MKGLEGALECIELSFKQLAAAKTWVLEHADLMALASYGKQMVSYGGDKPALYIHRETKNHALWLAEATRATIGGLAWKRIRTHDRIDFSGECELFRVHIFDCESVPAPPPLGGAQ